MPIFTSNLRTIDPADPVQAVKTMENHIRYLQEQLEYTLANLDSSNIAEIDTGETTITSSGGGVDLGKNELNLTGKNGEQFRVGYDEAEGVFRFEVSGRGGNKSLYMDAGGTLILTKTAGISMDCGEW